MKLDEMLAAYARLAVEVGVNLQPGQRLAVNGYVEHAPLVRAVAAAAYEAGAAYVDVYYADQRVRREHIKYASTELLGWSPPWLVKRIEDLDPDGGAMLVISSSPEPRLFADLDGARVAGARMRELSEAGLKLTAGKCNWAIVAYPSAEWARLVFGEPDVDRLWDAIATTVRLDEPDPVAAWKEHLERLGNRAAALNERGFDSLRYRGPGTDLTVGLHEDAIWQTAVDLSRGIEHVANMPTEEVFTTPDARRVDGNVAATYPLQLQGTVITNLRIRFEGGRAVEVDADDGRDLIRGYVESDEGASRLGEVALVDRTSRVGQTGLVFYDTLFDENAASHIALGDAIVQAVPGAETLTPEERHERGINHSTLHTDFMIGSNEVVVAGVTRAGDEVPILVAGDWVLS